MVSEPTIGKLTLTATAEVRDKDGNLVSSTPVELTAEVTEEEAAKYIESQETS